MNNYRMSMMGGAQMQKKRNIVVGISGGVDSAVAALLLKEQGHHIEGVFMQNWQADKDDPFCSAEQDLTDARAVCNHLKIPLHLANFSKEYWDRVFQHFLDEYSAGRTPNPDIVCNKEIKFRAFLDEAIKRGADTIATGHYARRLEKDGVIHLLKGIDSNKDQSYFLHTLDQAQLHHALFPIGDMKKDNVRNIAREAGFPNHAKKDSTGICFIGERRFKDFLSEYLLAQPGDIESTEGNVIGRHDGVMFYTLGQRKGLGIGGLRDGMEHPWYVIKKDTERNALIVAQEHDHPDLLSNTLTCHACHWIAGSAPTFPLTCAAKTRYRQSESHCQVIEIRPHECKVIFTEPQWAVTPGQSVVFYQGDECLGGGVITGGTGEACLAPTLNRL